jgi:enoyl-CoA hydratase/carnithine racemase
MLALAHDFRVMRADRGFFCLNEVDIGLPLHPGMIALVKNRLGPTTLRDVVLTGARIGGTEARERGIADEAVPASEVLPAAIARATALAQKDRGTYAALKRGIYGDLLSALDRAR